MLLIGLGLLINQAAAIYKYLTLVAVWCVPVNSAVVVGLWLLWLLRRRLSYRPRAMLFLGCLWVMAVASVASYGPVALSKGYFILLALLAVLLLGNRAGWISLGLVGLSLLTIGYGASSGLLVYGLDYPVYAGSALVWVQNAFGYTLFAGISARVAARIIGSLDQAVVGLAAHNAELHRSAQALRDACAEARTANRAKDRLLAMVSHELRGPLHILLGQVGLLMRAEASALERPEMLRDLRRTALLLQERVRDLLDLARAEGAAVPLRPAPCDPVAIVREAAAQLRAAMREKGLALRLDSALARPAAPPTPQPIPPSIQVLLDPGRLSQAVSNLLDNAVKYTAVGTISLRLRSRVRRHRPDRLVLAILVRDTGAGIAAADQARVFRPFERVGAAAAPGSGLGLAIARALVEAMDGRLRLSSRPGQGSWFWIGFPALEPAGAPPAACAAAPVAAPMPNTSAEPASCPAPLPNARAAPSGLDAETLVALCRNWLRRWRTLDPDEVAAFAEGLRDWAEARPAPGLERWAAALAAASNPSTQQRLLAELPDLLPPTPPPQALEALRG